MLKRGHKVSFASKANIEAFNVVVFKKIYPRENKMYGQFLKFQVNSFYGSRGGLQYIGLTGSSTPVPNFKGKMLDL